MGETRLLYRSLHFSTCTPFISYAGATHLAVDPGTHAYGARSHTTWDEMTVAHNTLVVDETTQSPATGKSLDWQVLPGATEIRVSSGTAYASVDFSGRWYKRTATLSTCSLRMRRMANRTYSTGCTTIFWGHRVVLALDTFRWISAGERISAPFGQQIN